MKTIQIGSFEAKTRFSQLLQEAEKGKSFDLNFAPRQARGATQGNWLGSQPETRTRSVGFFSRYAPQFTNFAC
ncbi:MAG: hypothetical protein PHP98_06815 [Kiritimatiellae bacterium]|nr:hypothetical protein [Kiritimatiellia bacterium]